MKDLDKLAKVSKIRSNDMLNAINKLKNKEDRECLKIELMLLLDSQGLLVETIASELQSQMKVKEDKQ